MLQWTAASGANGYAIQAGILNPSPTFVTDDTKFEVKGLSPNTEYQITVAAINSGGSTTQVAYIVTRK